MRGRLTAATGGAVAAALRACARRPGRVAGIAAALLCGGAVALNALSQPTRHPAPLFGRVSARIESPRRPDPAPLPVPRPEPAQLAAAAAAPETPLRGGADPIGALIRGEPPKPLEIKADSSRVQLVQKALTRLGYGPLKADGQMGATTRGAIEQFERDQKLPVSGTGGVGTRTVRQLAAMSGTPIE